LRNKLFADKFATAGPPHADFWLSDGCPCLFGVAGMSFDVAFVSLGARREVKITAG
jgi:hypothetical protein